MQENNAVHLLRFFKKRFLNGVKEKKKCSSCKENDSILSVCSSHRLQLQAVACMCVCVLFWVEIHNNNETFQISEMSL